MNKELQYKLSNYEAAPPAHIWDEVAAALDEQTTPHAAVLFNYQQAPPAEVWDKIEQSLYAEPSKQEAVPLYNRKRSFVKYAAAAALLIMIASAITIVITRNQKSNELADQPVPTLNQDSNNTLSTDSGEKDNDNLESVNQKREKETKPGVATVTDVSNPKKESGRYLTMANDNGKKVRLSKKVASVFDCADNAASSKSIRCKESIESLQQKMSASLVSPSGDFSGLIDMIKSLEENK